MPFLTSWSLGASASSPCVDGAIEIGGERQ
jgi:hypothetical protein